MLMNEHDDACVDVMLMVNMQANTRSVTLHTLREGIYHHCLGKDPKIPQKRDLRESHKESLSFI